jgi:hypothetical protein
VDDLGDPWETPDGEPTASPYETSPVVRIDPDQERQRERDRERQREREEASSPPSFSEMAGDGAEGGDGIDEPGWD